MGSNIKDILSLFMTIRNLKKENGTIKQLSQSVNSLNRTLELIYQDQKESFDVQIDIVDYSSGKTETLFTVPSTKFPYVKLCIDCVKFSLNDLEDLILGQSKMSNILSCKSFFSIKASSFTSFCSDTIEDTWKFFKQRVGYKRPIVPQELNSAKECLLNENVVWCYNSSCSGKTWLGIQTIDMLNIVDTRKIVCNMGLSQLLDIQYLYIILEYGKNCSLLVDDMQCDPDSSKYVLDFLKENKLHLKLCQIFVFLVSWNSFADQYVEYLNCFSRIKTDPRKFELFLKGKIEDQQLSDLCGSNLSLLSKAALLRTSKCLNKKEALFKCFVQTEDLEQIQLVYIASVLGKYDFETPITFLDSYGKLNRDTVIDAKFYSNVVYIGHRNICTFITSYIEQVYNPILVPKELLEEYINHLDGTLKWRALVHLIGTNTQSDIHKTGFIWNLLNTLMVFLEKESKKDPTWNRTPSSMYFVLRIADYFNELDKYRRVAEAFKSCFSVNNYCITVDFAKIRTADDFMCIKKCMIEEDSLHCFDSRFESGTELDQNEMHLNWLLSLIVGLSNVLKYFGMTELLEAARRSLLNRQYVGGYWYPYRVPWITACAMRGLAYDGMSKENAHIIKAIEYLRSVMNEEGYWEAYTGGWNGVFETTSMCLEALNNCKVNCRSDPSFLKSVEYLELYSSKWLHNDLEGVSTACLLMDIKGVSENLLEYVQNFTVNIVQKLLENEREEELQSQSCAAALTSFYTIALCWNILERDLSELMDEFIEDANKENISENVCNALNQSNSVINITIGTVENVQINGGNGTQIN